MTASTRSMGLEGRPALAAIKNVKLSYARFSKERSNSVRESSMDFVKDSLGALCIKTLPSSQSIETVDTSTSDSTPVVLSTLEPRQAFKDSDLESDLYLTAPSHRSFDELPLLEPTPHPHGMTLKRGRACQTSHHANDCDLEGTSFEATSGDSKQSHIKIPQEQIPERPLQRPNWAAAPENVAIKNQIQNGFKRARVESELKVRISKPERPRHFPVNPDFKPVSSMPLDPDLEDGEIQVDPEYFEDHIKYFREKEDEFKCQVDYMAHQQELRWSDRATLVTWMINLVHKYKLLPTVIYLATNLFDRFLSLRLASRSRVPFTALACAFIATKYETRLHPSPEQFLSSCGIPISKDELAICEEYVLKVLDYRLGYPNPFRFLRYVSVGDGCHLKTRLMARYLMEQCLPSNTFINCAGSLLACAAMHISRKILGRGSWNDDMIKYSQCGREEVVRTAKHMIDLLLMESDIKGSRDKYGSPEYLGVAVIARKWIAERRSLVANLMGPRV